MLYAPRTVPYVPRTVALQASNPLHVLIAGAGVGGLALANQLQLSDAHVTYTVLEKTNEFRKFGGPIQLASNAMESLKNLDAELYGEIEARVIARHPSSSPSPSAASASPSPPSSPRPSLARALAFFSSLTCTFTLTERHPTPHPHPHPHQARATWTGNRTNGIKDGVRNEWCAMLYLLWLHSTCRGYT